MEKLLQTGKVKAIGISNFSRVEMERLVDKVSVVPAVHQLELHPWLQQRPFVEWHKAKDIHIIQYSPFGNQNEMYSGPQHLGKLLEEPVLNEIGKKYGKSSAQIALGKSCFSSNVGLGISSLTKADSF
jgi:alcohol dehydrogenase (NADP+)